MPAHRREAQTIEYGDKGRYTSGPSPNVPATTTATGRERVKGEIIRSRITKQSQSPDKYHLNNNLVVQLADPIRKPGDKLDLGFEFSKSNLAMLKLKCIKPPTKMVQRQAFSHQLPPRLQMVLPMTMGLKILAAPLRVALAQRPILIKRAFKSLTQDRTTMPSSSTYL